MLVCAFTTRAIGLARAGFVRPAPFRDRIPIVPLGFRWVRVVKVGCYWDCDAMLRRRSVVCLNPVLIEASVDGFFTSRFSKKH